MNAIIKNNEMPHQVKVLLSRLTTEFYHDMIGENYRLLFSDLHMHVCAHTYAYTNTEIKTTNLKRNAGVIILI